MFKNRLNDSLAAAIVAPAIALTPVAVSATTLDEVVVTADFVDQALMESAGSTTVIDADAIAAQGLVHIENLLHGAANINFSSGGARSRFVQVRGVGDLEQFRDPKNYPSVGVMVDGVELAGNAAAAMLFDMEQVEVLRGPQGTAYGAAGHAGLINMRSAQPAEQQITSLSAGIGNYGVWQAGAVLSGPLNDEVGYRVAVQQNRGDGYVDNQYLGSDDSNGYDEMLVRAKLSWQIDPLTRVDLSAQHMDLDNGYDAWSLDSPRKTVTDQPGVDAQQINALSATISHTHHSGAVSEIILHHSSVDSDYGYDADWVYAGFHNETDTATEYFLRDQNISSVELRWMSAQSAQSSYVVGLYARQGEEDLDYANNSLWYGDYAAASAYQTDRVALYGQYQQQLSDKLSLTAGLRYENFRDDYSDSNGFVSSSEEHLWSGELTLNYAVADNTLIYATLSQGEKPGGINTSTSANQPWMSPDFQDFTADNLAFAAETLINAELGVKWRSADSATAVRAALFHNQRDNAQLENWMWDNDAGLWIGYLDSNSDMNSYGAELELTRNVSQSTQLFASLGLLRTEVASIQAFDLDQWGFVTQHDRQQAKSPKYQYSVGADMQLNNQLSARVAYQGRGDSYFGYYHNGKLGSYNLLNASVNYQRDNLQLTLWGRNLTDKEYAVHGLYFAADPRNGWMNESHLQYGEPRTYGITATMSF